ncbi:hypothetical protein DSUL_20014 [Desulfovibrionales bacterium]
MLFERTLDYNAAAWLQDNANHSGQLILYESGIMTFFLAVAALALLN